MVDCMGALSHPYIRGISGGKMTIVEIIIADLHCLSIGGRLLAYVCSCNCCCECGLCWPAMNMWDVHSLRLNQGVSAAHQLHNINGKCGIAAPYTRNQRLIANMSNRVCWCPASSVTWCDWCLLSVLCARR